jgi:hypothetical protein
MASHAPPTRHTLLAHAAFFLVVALVPIGLSTTRGVSDPNLRWMLVYTPFWLWLLLAIRRSPRSIRLALMTWSGVSIVAAALAGPLADLTIVPRVVWIVGELGVVFHSLGALLREHSQPGLAVASEVMSHIAIVTAVTTGVTWFFARGAYETSIRLIDHADVRHLIHGSIGALIGVAVSTTLVRAWFSAQNPVEYGDGTVLAA